MCYVFYTSEECAYKFNSVLGEFYSVFVLSLVSDYLPFWTQWEWITAVALFFLH